MEPILTRLQELDELYHKGNQEAYEQCLQEISQQIQQVFPGFTLAYAEIVTTQQVFPGFTLAYAEIVTTQEVSASNTAGCAMF